MSDSVKKTARTEDYLLPNLCQGEGLLGLLLLAGLLSVLTVLLRGGISAFDFVLFGKSALLAFWIALLSAFLLCWARERLIGMSARSAAMINYFLVLLAAAVCAGAGELWLRYSTTADWGIDVLSVLDIVIITAIPAGVMLRMLYLQQQVRQQQRAELESRIEALQSKIRPHFLFNSMNILASLISIDPVKAEQAVENLSDLFRYALSDVNQEVPLSEEVEVCQRYLELEKFRLEERLTYSWQIEADIENIQVPPLILQPLVENAVFHGIQPSPEGGDLEVSIRSENGWVSIEVVNSLPETEEVTSGHQIALQNLRYRLEAFFNQQAELMAVEKEGRYYTCIRFKPQESGF